VQGEYVVRFADGKIFARHPDRMRDFMARAEKAKGLRNFKGTINDWGNANCKSKPNGGGLKDAEGESEDEDDSSSGSVDA
jgi:hypothetical protein